MGCLTEHCTVDLMSCGYDDSTQFHGYVKTSGGSSDTTYRGVTLFELDPKTCTTRSQHQFDTWGSSSATIQLLQTLELATWGTIIVGVTTDSAENDSMEFQKSAASHFVRYNMNISGLMNRDKFAFMMQKGFPLKTVFHRKLRYGEGLKVKILLIGKP